MNRHTTSTLITNSKAVTQYIKVISDSNKKTGIIYSARLRLFEDFWTHNYAFTLDELLIKHIFRVDIYDLLSKYVSFLVSKRTRYTNLTIKQYIITVKNFFEYFDIEV